MSPIFVGIGEIKITSLLKQNKFKLILLLFLIVLLVAAHFLKPVLMVGIAYKSKVLCSGVFVSQRDAAGLLAIDLGVDDLAIMRVIASEIDITNKQVSASFLGLFKKTAYYKEGLGCIHAARREDIEQLHSVSFPARSTSDQKLDIDINHALDDTLDWAFSETSKFSQRRTRAVVVLQDGHIVAERYAPGFNASTPMRGWSMTKSIMNALVGILVQQNRITLDSRPPIEAWSLADDPRHKITYRHLLNMNAGLAFNENYSSMNQDGARMLLKADDKAAYGINKPLAHDVGSQWRYSSVTSNILSYCIKKAVGDAEYMNFPKQYLFSPLGINSAVIEPDASGTFVGSSYMYATARDWATFGQLYVQDGVWNGHRILPKGWVKFSSTPARQAPNKRYGAHFWLQVPHNYKNDDSQIKLPPDTFHAVGRSGQFVTIIPSKRLVIVRLGLSRAIDAWSHDAFVDRVLKALRG